MTGVYEIRPAQWWDWPFHGIRAFEESSIPAVTTLPASDDQQAVTVRFIYPGDAMRQMKAMEAVDRSAHILPSSLDWASDVLELRAWKESAMSVLSEWDQVWETLGRPGRLGDSIAAASKKEVERIRGLIRDGGCPVVSGSCPDRPVNPKIAKLFLNAWGNMCGGEQ
jgi:hypothetical protein